MGRAVRSLGFAPRTLFPLKINEHENSVPPVPRLWPPGRRARAAADEARQRAGRQVSNADGAVRGRACVGEAPAACPPVDLRRRERRSLLFGRRAAAHLPVEARRAALRPDLRDERGWLERPNGFDRQGPNDLLLLLPRRQTHPLLLDAPRLARLPAVARLLARLRLGDLSGLRHLHGQTRRL